MWISAASKNAVMKAKISPNVKPCAGHDMHILQLLPSKVLGGLEQVCTDYCRILTERGDRVTVILHPQAKMRKQLSELNINLVFDKSVSVKRSHFNPLTMLRFRKYIKLHKPDIVIVHNGRNVPLMRYACKNIAPLIAVNHGTKSKRTIGVDAVIAVNTTLQKHIVKAGQKVDTTYYLQNMIVTGDVEFTAAGDYKNDIPVIGAMARFDAAKGLEDFIESISLLKKSGVIFKVLIGGGGKEKLELELRKKVKNLLLEKDIQFIGWVSDKERFFKEIDIFCLPSRFEPFGIVLLEAMLYGCPIVATDCEGPLDIIKDEYNGILTERGNPESLASGIRKILSDTPLRLKIVKNSYNILKEKYDSGIVGNKLKSILIEVENRFKKI